MSTFVDLYDYYCRRSRCRPNSQFLAYLREQCANPENERSLKNVDVSNNYVGKKGIVPVLDLVKNVKTVVSVDVSSNMLEHEQLEHLIQCLLPHPSITRVVLRNNYLLETSANLLMHLLQGNVSITEIDVEGNGFLPSTVARLVEQTARNAIAKAKINEEHEQQEAVGKFNAAHRWCAHVKGHLNETESGGYIHFATWWTNPQYVLRVSHTARVEIVMDVQNEILSRQAGFLVMRSNSVHPRRIHHIADDTIVCESDMSCTHCRVETRLQPDAVYFLMPYMFRPKHAMDYTLRVALRREEVTLEAPWATLELVDARYDWCVHTFTSEWTSSCAGGAGTIVNVDSIRDSSNNNSSETKLGHGGDTHTHSSTTHDHDQHGMTMITSDETSSSGLVDRGRETYYNTTNHNWRMNNMYRLMAAPRSPTSLRSTVTVSVLLYKSTDPDCNDERSIGLDVVEPEACYGGRPPLWYDPRLVRAHRDHERVTCVHLQFEALLADLDVYVVPSTALTGQTGAYTLVMFSSSPLQCIPSTFPHQWHHRLVAAHWDEMSCGGSPLLNQSWRNNPAICIRTHADTPPKGNDEKEGQTVLCSGADGSGSRGATVHKRIGALMACLQPCGVRSGTRSLHGTVTAGHDTYDSKNSDDEDAYGGGNTAAELNKQRYVDNMSAAREERSTDLPPRPRPPCNRMNRSAGASAKPTITTKSPQQDDVNHDDHFAPDRMNSENRSAASLSKACCVACVHGNLCSVYKPCQESAFSSAEAVLRLDPIPAVQMYLVAMTQLAGELGSFRLHLFSTEPFVVEGVRLMSQWEREAQLAQYTVESAMRQVYATLPMLSPMHVADAASRSITTHDGGENGVRCGRGETLTRTWMTDSHALKMLHEVRRCIASDCESTGLMYSDRDFPRGASSLWLDPQQCSPPNDFPRTWIWVRSNELSTPTCNGATQREEKQQYIQERYVALPGSPVCLRHGRLSPPCAHSGRQHWFASVVQSLAAKPHWLARLFVAYHPSHGYAQFRFFKHHAWVGVTVDDYLAVDGTGSLCFGQSVDTADVFYPLMEKAYAKLHRCYEALEHKVTPQLCLMDDFVYGLTDLSGGYCARHVIRQPTGCGGCGGANYDMNISDSGSGSESNHVLYHRSCHNDSGDEDELGRDALRGGLPSALVVTDSCARADGRVSAMDSEELWRTLKTVTQPDVHISLVLRTTPTSSDGGAVTWSSAMYDKMGGVDLTGRSQVGLLPDRLYGVLDARWVEKQRLVQLRNWPSDGHTTWRGRWQRSSHRWTDVLREALHYYASGNEDVIWLDLDEVVYYFTDMMVTRLYPHLTSTAASCFGATANMEDSLCDNVLLRNPQYSLRLAEADTQSEEAVGSAEEEKAAARGGDKANDDDEDRLIDVVIGLHQVDSRMSITRSKSATATYKYALGIVVFRAHDTTQRLTHVDQSQVVRFVSPQATRDSYCVISVTPASLSELMVIPFRENAEKDHDVTYTMTARCAHGPVQLVLVKHNELHTVEGAWARGSAGGQPSSFDWRNNKQYLLMPSESMNVCITLTRHPGNSTDDGVVAVGGGKDGESGKGESCNTVAGMSAAHGSSSTSHKPKEGHSFDSSDEVRTAEAGAGSDGGNTLDYTDQSGCEIGFTVHTTRRCSSMLHFDSSSVVLHVPAVPGQTSHSVSGTVRLLGPATRRGMPYVIVPYCRRRDTYFGYTLSVSANKAVRFHAVDARLDWKRVDDLVRVSSEDGSAGGSPAFPSWRCSPQRVITFPLSCEGRLLLSATNVSREGAHHRIGLTVLWPDMRWDAGMRRKLTMCAAEDEVARTGDDTLTYRSNNTDSNTVVDCTAQTRMCNNYDTDEVKDCLPGHTELDIDLDALKLSRRVRCTRPATQLTESGGEKRCAHAWDACGVNTPPDRLVVVVYTERPYLDADIQLSIYSTHDISVAPVKEWHSVSIYEGGWDLGQTSGGSRMRYPSWVNNPFFAVRTLRPTNIVALLIQYPRGRERCVVKRYGKKKAFLPPPIFNMDNRISIELDLVHDDDARTSVQRSGPTLDTELTMTAKLDVRDDKPYLLVPSTSKSAEDADFKLLIYADHPIDVRRLEKERVMYLP